MFQESKCTSLLQQIRTTKLPAFFQRFQTEECALRVHETKITAENAFHFGTEGNNESDNDEKPCLRYFSRFVTHKATFLSIICFFQFVSHALFLLKANTKLIRFYTKFQKSKFFLVYKCTSPAKLLAFFQRFQTEVGVLRVNK